MQNFQLKKNKQINEGQAQSSKGNFGVVCSLTTAATSKSFPLSGETSTRNIFPRHCEFMADG